MHSHRDAEHHEARRRLDPADGAQAEPHPDGRVRGERRVVVAGEQEQQRVAAELQETATRGVGDFEELLEARVDRVGDFFGADFAVTRQPLRHLGEAGDVGEHHGALDQPPGRTRVADRRVGARPVEGQPRNIGNQRARSCHVSRRYLAQCEGAMATIGWLRTIAPVDPKKRALKANTPPSDATNQ